MQHADPGVGVPGGDHALDKDSLEGATPSAPFAGEAWFGPIEIGIRGRIRGLIEELVEQELDRGAGSRPLWAGGTAGRRHGHRRRRLTGSFGPVEIAVPRARLRGADGVERAWRSAVLPRDARRTRQMEALIASACLSGTNTRRVQRTLAALFRGTIGKDVVSRAWREAKADWDAWCRRDLGAEDVVRLVLDGTVMKVRLDRKATSLSLLVVLGIRRDGQKVLLAARSMGGESEAAWRGVLDDLVVRGLRTPEFLIVDGAAGLEKALAALWPAVPTQRRTVHKHRNLLAHAPERLFAFTRLPPSPWKSARTTNSIERLHEEFKRRIQTQTRLPSAETAAMLFSALLASGQIAMRKVDGGSPSASRSPPARSTPPPEPIPSARRRRRSRIPTAFATAPVVVPPPHS